MEGGLVSYIFCLINRNGFYLCGIHESIEDKVKVTSRCFLAYGVGIIDRRLAGMFLLPRMFVYKIVASVFIMDGDIVCTAGLGGFKIRQP